MKTILFIGRFLLAVILLFLVLVTFFARVYFQSVFLAVALILLLYWPKQILENKLGTFMARYGRIILVILLIAGFQIVSRTTRKESIYRSDRHRESLHRLYKEKLNYWPVNYERLYIDTEYGKVHVIACGKDTSPPVLLFHAAAMGAISWADNIPALVDKYRIYAIDNIGEGNMSELYDAEIFPGNGRELAALYAAIADSLGVKCSPVIGASNGGFIGIDYAYYYPERVKSLILLGPMGLTQLSDNSIMMMSLPSMLPLKFIRKPVIKWAIGDDKYVLDRYGDWFDMCIKSMFSSIAQPVPVTNEQKSKMHMPVLLILGTKDPIVGDVEFAKQTARDFPNIEIEVLESGHLMGVEKAQMVNAAIRHFLNKDKSIALVVMNMKDNDIAFKTWIDNKAIELKSPAHAIMAILIK